MTAVVCLAFQACAQSDPLGESASGSPMGSGGDYLSPNMGQESSRTNPDEGLSGMVQWLDQPVPKDVTKRTTTATSTTPTPMLPNQLQLQLTWLPVPMMKNQL